MRCNLRVVYIYRKACHLILTMEAVCELCDCLGSRIVCTPEHCQNVARLLDQSALGVIEGCSTEVAAPTLTTVTVTLTATMTTSWLGSPLLTLLSVLCTVVTSITCCIIMRRRYLRMGQQLREAADALQDARVT